MSDTAHIVATVLRDRAMLDMMAELEQLKRLVDDRFKVQITGRKGFPVYREGSLRNGYTTHRGRCFEVMFDDSENYNDEEANQTTSDPGGSPKRRGVLPLTALGALEIRLGGIVVQRLEAHTVLASCNSPFFTHDDFYRDTKYNKPEYLALDRREVILKVKPRKRGPVPFVIGRFGSEMNLWDYHKLHQLDTADLLNLFQSGRASTIILDGLTFSKPEIQETLSVLETMKYGVDEGNCHRQYVHSVDTTKVPVRSPRRASQSAPM